MENEGQWGALYVQFPGPSARLGIGIRSRRQQQDKGYDEPFHRQRWFWNQSSCTKICKNLEMRIVTFPRRYTGYWIIRQVLV